MLLLQVLIDHYKDGLHLTREETVVEWVSLRSNLIQHPERYEKLPDTLKLISKSEAYPNLSKVATAALVIPASTAGISLSIILYCQKEFKQLITYI